MPGSTAEKMPVVFGKRFALSEPPHFFSLSSEKEKGRGEEALFINSPLSDSGASSSHHVRGSPLPLPAQHERGEGRVSLDWRGSVNPPLPIPLPTPPSWGEGIHHRRGGSIKQLRLSPRSFLARRERQNAADVLRAE